MRKQRGLGAGRVVAPGGKVEPGETPREASRREVREEVGVRVAGQEKAGELVFSLPGRTEMRVHVYVAERYDGTPTASDEAEPFWADADRPPLEEMWPDDRYWWPVMRDGDRFRAWFVGDMTNGEIDYGHVRRVEGFAERRAGDD